MNIFLFWFSYFRISVFLCYIRARANPFAGFQTGRGGMHEISPDELFNMFFNVRTFMIIHVLLFIIHSLYWILICLRSMKIFDVLMKLICPLFNTISFISFIWYSQHHLLTLHDIITCYYSFLLPPCLQTLHFLDLSQNFLSVTPSSFILLLLLFHHPVYIFVPFFFLNLHLLFLVSFLLLS